MPRNASGIYTLPGGNPVTPGDVIEAEWANTTLEDVADALTNSLSRTGAGGMLAPFRIADGTISGPGLSFLNETNTGLYRSASGSAWMAVLGVNVAQFSTVGLTIPFGKALTAQGNASVSGTLAVTGATTLGSSLAVTGALTATGGVTGNVTGNVTAASGTSTFNDVVITGALDMTAGSSATITGLSTPTNASDAANKGYVDSQDALKLSLSGGTMAGNINMNGYTIAYLATPTADSEAATKAYVDSVAQGLDAKASCKAATTANITLSGAQIIDGAGCAVGDRVLVKNQASATQNGIYVVSNSTWTRATDADTWNDLVAAFTFVEQGTVNGNSGWVCTATAGGTLGVTPVTFVQFSGAGQIDAGAGLQKSGNTLSVGTASSSRIVVNADDIDLATTGVTASTYKSVTVDAYGRVTAGTNPTTIAGYGITDAYTTAQVDAALALKLNLTGGTMSGVIAMGANKITGLADPTNPQDAATKTYIDTIFGSTATAAASAAAAATSASNASTSATNSATSASQSAASAAAAAASYDSFDDRYLGAKASDPTVDNDGNPLITGALYFNSTVNEMRVYNGSAWVAAYLPAAGYMDLTTNQTAAGVKTFSSNPVLSAGTAQGVTFLNASKAITTSSTFVLDTSGNFGVGTSAPKVRVQWSAASAENAPVLGTAKGIGYFTNNDANYGLLVGNSSATGAAWLQAQRTDGTATAYDIVLNPAGGNLGLGVTPSAWDTNRKVLQIGGSGALWAGSSGAGTLFSSNNTYFDGTNFRYLNTSGATYFAQSTDGSFSWNRASSGTAGNAITFTQAMTLDASGRLGLGRTSMSYELDVSGNNGGGIRYTDNTYSVQNLFGCYNGTGLVGTLTNHPLTFFVNNVERARISAAGGFSVGTTADPGAGAIYATGNITAYYSDKRLKTVSGKIENALDKVAQLSGVYYTNNDVAKSFGYDSDETQVGVLAQEVEAVLPQVVKAAPFDLDENGNSKSGENYKTVQYDRIVPLLIEAIKELRAEVKALRGE